MRESSPNTNDRFVYIHDVQNGPTDAIDVHRIVVQRNGAKGFLVYLSALFLFALAFFLFLFEGDSVTVIIWCSSISIFLAKLCCRRPVTKESVIIMPTFGVQLETEYARGRTVRRFVPIGRILKPVLYECVTPVTCYWSLSLIIREEDDLLLVFKETRPPVRMLVPIWKALCFVTNSKESHNTSTEK